ncbi:LOW QUALITY PROTEIN: insulin-like growth factor-binding protein 6b [Embiotoca jacksoni]|uniref:LOW QUALITY PROTEIN: insulin-like growth factor-binding protein 6b n=1 Tax=Embiotoca jacksoni TaxID=100190 RepID=UPI0037039344
MNQDNRAADGGAPILTSRSPESPAGTEPVENQSQGPTLFLKCLKSRSPTADRGPGRTAWDPFKVCPSCRDPLGAGRPPRDHSAAGSTSVLAQGEPCGVYTLSCAKGLRCVPRCGEHSPLQALLQGRGLCAKHSRTSPTERPHPTGPHPSHSGDIEKAPCRKLLNSVLRGLELTIFQSDRDIYIPNCDTRGFYRKKAGNQVNFCESSIHTMMMMMKMREDDEYV